MISGEVDERRARAVFGWAILLSILLHALLVPLAFWSAGLKLLAQAAKPPEREMVVSSTSVRIEKRSVPRPMTHPNRAATAHPAHRSTRPLRSIAHAPAARVQRPLPPKRAPAQPRELARLVPRASPQPAAGTPQPRRATPVDQQLAQQEQQFSQEVAQLRKQDNPLSIATRAPRPPAAFRRTYFDVPGHQEREIVQAVLMPLRHWDTGTLSCYYTHYVAEYAHGGSEEGTIPWPVCYPIGDDRMANPPWVHTLPIPVPQPGYVLPANTYLTPLLKSIYSSRP